MKILFTIIFVLAFRAYSAEIKFTVEPVIDQSLMARELQPLIDYHYNGYALEYVPSYSLSHLVTKIKTREIDMMYASSSYFYLLKEHGYVPVLRSRQKDRLVSITKGSVSKGQDYRLYHVKNDLTSMIYMLDRSFPHAEVIATTTSESAILAVLKSDSVRAVVMEGELNFLNDVMLKKLTITEVSDIGAVYLMVHKSKLSILDTWINGLIKFHNNFNDPESYNYLNHYQFDRYQGEDPTWSSRQEEYLETIENILQ